MKPSDGSTRIGSCDHCEETKNLARHSIVTGDKIERVSWLCFDCIMRLLRVSLSHRK